MLLFLAGLLPAAHASVLDFEDLTNSDGYAEVPAEYQGLSWGPRAEVWVRPWGSDPAVDRSIRGEVAVFGSEVVFGGDPFELDGMWIAAAVTTIRTGWATVQGFSGGVLVGEETVALEAGVPVWFAPEWAGVDVVEVTGVGCELVLDDVLLDAGPDVDSDGDGVVDRGDLCPSDFDPEQADSDGDFTGDACDADAPEIPEAPPASPATIDFESLDPGGPGFWELPEGYAGLSWTDAYWFTESSGVGTSEAGVSLARGQVAVLAYSGEGLTLSRDGFELDGLFAGALECGDSYVVLEGQRDGVVVDRTWTPVRCEGLTYVPVGWTDLDRVVISGWPSDVVVDDLLLDSGPGADGDGDGVEDRGDVCPDLYDVDQADADSDGRGDACDDDLDNDGIVDELDDCVDAADADQADADGDGVGDACEPPDAQVLDFETLSAVWYGSYSPDMLGEYGRLSWQGFSLTDPEYPPVPVHGEMAARVSSGTLSGHDIELDGFRAGSNPWYSEACTVEGLRDGVVVQSAPIEVQPGPMQWFAFEWTGLSEVHFDCGDVTVDDIVINSGPDVDSDADGIFNRGDNCPAVANPDQADADTDYEGDACDVDLDDDGVADAVDLCPEVSDAAQADEDGDGLGDACDEDRDEDGVVNDEDLCPDLATDDPYDSDQDGVGDDCDEVDGMVFDFEELYYGYEYESGSALDLTSSGFSLNLGTVTSGWLPRSGNAYGIDGRVAAIVSAGMPFTASREVPFDLSGLRLGSTFVPYQYVWLEAWSEDGGVVLLRLTARNDRAEVYDLGLTNIVWFSVTTSDGDVTVDDVRINEGGSDLDEDGVYNDPDLCADTVSGAAVDADGCSGAQEVALACPTDRAWPSHVAYARCVGTAANAAQRKGLLTSAERVALVSAAVGPRR